MAHGLARRESVDSEMHKSTDKRKTFVFTKKRGYDVTRNPHLNKVSGVSVGGTCVSLQQTNAQQASWMPSGSVGNGNTVNRRAYYT